MTTAQARRIVPGAVRIFETYPPSSFAIAIVAAIVLLIAGLEFVPYFLLGAAITGLCRWLDYYGVRRHR